MGNQKLILRGGWQNKDQSVAHKLNYSPDSIQLLLRLSVLSPLATSYFHKHGMYGNIVIYGNSTFAERISKNILFFAVI